MAECGELKQHALPESYANLRAVPLKKSVCFSAGMQCTSSQGIIGRCKSRGTKLGQTCTASSREGRLTCEDAIAWSACHASKKPLVNEPPARCALLPLFYEKSATPTMTLHGKHAFFNPGQIPVSTFDQPLFALAKLVQWKWPGTHGEKVNVVMLGCVHTEMGCDLLECSGWTTALTEAEVASSGVADSVLKATHLTQTRHAHQVTLLTQHLEKLYEGSPRSPRRSPRVHSH